MLAAAARAAAAQRRDAPGARLYVNRFVTLRHPADSDLHRAGAAPPSP